MQFINHYSSLLVIALLLVVGSCIVVRRGGKRREWLVLSGVVAVCAAFWLILRPIAKSSSSSAGKACLLEVQSPYCLACLVMKPKVDQLETTWSGKLTIRRVDIQSEEGGKLAQEYNVDATPTFIFFDASGKEQWRSVGGIDGARVRDSLESR